MHILDRPLLLGLAALERDLISPTQLIDAFRTWRHQPESSLGRILAERGNLSDECIQSLEQLLADSLHIDATADTGTDGNAPTKTWQHNTASLAADGEPTTSHHWSPRP